LPGVKKMMALGPPECQNPHRTVTNPGWAGGDVALRARQQQKRLARPQGYVPALVAHRIATRPVARGSHPSAHPLTEAERGRGGARRLASRRRSEPEASPTFFVVGEPSGADRRR